MIVKSLPRLQEGQQINASSLYTVYTNLWVERDFNKGRVVLDRDTKLALMRELAWKLWTDEKAEFSTNELVKFVTALHAAKALEFGEEEVNDIVREVQAASFVRRDRKGDSFTFMHRSFGEFFLAGKLLAALKQPGEGTRAVLNTRRIDRKVIYFLTLLDEKGALRVPLQAILTGAYTQNVSENALQILYWSGRVRCGMQEKVEDLVKLRSQLATQLPEGAQLAGAQLQGAMLEGASFTRADFTGADLTKANLNDAALMDCKLPRAKLGEARAERLSCERVDFRAAEVRGAIFTDAALTDCDFTDADFQPSQLATANVQQPRGVQQRATLDEMNLLPVVQRGAPLAVNAVAWSREADLLAVGSQDTIIRLYRASDGRLLRILEGHSNSVLSVAFAPGGRTLASGSWDKTVKLWEVAGAAPGRPLRRNS